MGTGMHMWQTHTVCIALAPVQIQVTMLCGMISI